MKKLYFLFIFLLSALAYGQDMVITGAFDGPLSGGTPKLVEVYVINDIPDLSIYGFGSANNGGGTDNQELAFTGSATAGDFIYLASEGSNPGSVNAYFGITADYLDSAANVNGDDALELFQNGSVIDTFGDINTDGTGQAWEYLDGWAYRANGTGPDGGTFVIGNWTFSGPNAIDGCSTNASCGSQFPIGTYSATGGSPSVNIISPAGGSVFSPGTTSVDLEFAILNGGGSETVSVTVNGSTTNNATSPFPIAVMDGQTYNVTVELIDGGVLDSKSISFSVGSLVTVADVTALRADVTTNGEGGFYQITGASLVTHTDGFRNRKWIQDANSGVLIYDQDGAIVTTYSVGDLVSGLRGTTEIVNEVLRFIPTSDAGTIDSSGNAVIPLVVSIPDLNAAPDTYESRLIQLDGVTFTAADGVATFTTGTNYDVSDGVNTTVKRTDFFSADYIGQVIPSDVLNLIGVAGEFNGTSQIHARNLADLTLGFGDFQAGELTVYPNPANDLLNITTARGLDLQVEVFSILGKRVIATRVQNSPLDVSALTSGIYILKITEEDKTATQKLIIR